MNMRLLLAGGLLALVTASCTQKTAAPSNRPALAPARAEAPATAEQTHPKPAADLAQPNIPKDARWTIYCTTFSGRDHISRAKAMRDYLIQATARRDWYIVQGASQTTLYCGFYREISEARDPAEAGRAHADCRAVAALTNPQNGDRLFRGGVCLVDLEAADPPAPPEWNLVNARGYYSLQVAIYKDSPERKQYAVDSVREARKMGYEAYYYHGPTSSFVCIGAWPESAVIRNDDLRPSSPGVVPLVVTDGAPVPEGLTMPDGRPIEVIRPKFEVVDPTLKETMRKFDVLALNGLSSRRIKNPQTGEVRSVTLPSVLVTIPHNQATADAARQSDPLPPSDTTGQVGHAPTVSNAPPAPRPAPRPAGGRLKSLED